MAPRIAVTPGIAVMACITGSIMVPAPRFPPGVGATTGTLSRRSASHALSHAPLNRAAVPQKMLNEITAGRGNLNGITVRQGTLNRDIPGQGTFSGNAGRQEALSRAAGRGVPNGPAIGQGALNGLAVGQATLNGGNAGRQGALNEITVLWRARNGIILCRSARNRGTVSRLRRLGRHYRRP